MTIYHFTVYNNNHNNQIVYYYMIWYVYALLCHLANRMVLLALRNYAIWTHPHTNHGLYGSPIIISHIVGCTPCHKGLTEREREIEGEGEATNNTQKYSTQFSEAKTSKRSGDKGIAEKKLNKFHASLWLNIACRIYLDGTDKVYMLYAGFVHIHLSTNPLLNMLTAYALFVCISIISYSRGTTSCQTKEYLQQQKNQ